MANTQWQTLRKKVVGKSNTEIKLEKEIVRLQDKLESKITDNVAIKNNLSVEVENGRVLGLRIENLQSEIRVAKTYLGEKDSQINVLKTKISQLNAMFHSTLQLNTSMQHDFVDTITSDSDLSKRDNFREDCSV